MALSRVKTWIAGEVLTAADLNAEFNNILTNPVSLISPLTAALDFDGYTLTLDAAGVTQVQSTAAVSWNFTSGAKTGTPATTGSIANWSAQTFTDSATAGSGTAAAWTGFAIQRPTLTASNASVTTTDATTVYIPNAPAAGSNQTLTNAWALWIDDGASRFDGDVRVDGSFTKTVKFSKGADVASANALTLGTDGNYFDITGTTAITSITTISIGTVVKLHFDDALTLTHHATDLILPGGTNITTVAGDEAEFVEYDTGDWRCTSYTGVANAAFTTGDVKLTLKATADSGWVIMNDGSIGSAASGATTRANADTEALYTLLWTNIIDTWAPVSTGRGASAAADFAANKTLTLPRTLGRALAVSGAGASLTSRALGEYLGAETHTLTEAELAGHTHQQYAVDDSLNIEPLYTTASGNTALTTVAGTAAGGGSPVSTGSSGSGAAHNNMPPESFMNVMIKL